MILSQDCIPVGCVPLACCPYLPACTAPGGGSARGGVHASGPGGACLWSRGGACLWSRGGCLPLVPEGVGVSQHAMRQTPPPLWTERHLQKHNLRKLRLRVVSKFVQWTNYSCNIKCHCCKFMTQERNCSLCTGLLHGSQ